MTRAKIAALALSVAFAAGGCGSTEPTQPKLSEAQVQDLMKQGKDQSQKERGTRKPGT